MNNGGEAADQMVRESIQITEAAVKLSALGAKNLAAICLALAKDNPKVRGKTNLDHLLREGKELKVVAIKASDLAQFKDEAKKYGVLFAAIRDKTSEGELIDIMAKAEDVSKLNRIFERMGYPTPQEKVIARKKDLTCAPSDSASTMRGLGALPTGQTATASDRESVKAALTRLKSAADKIAAEAQKAVPQKASQQEEVRE